MNKIRLGIISGLAFGTIDVLLMVPIPMNDKPVAMIASFINRFAIGFFIVMIDLPLLSWLKGILIGLLLSFPDAIITKTYVPILGVGIIGGFIIGLVLKKKNKYFL